MLQKRAGHIDIARAYLQSGPIKRTVYDRPSLHVRKRGSVWKLTKLPYRISEAGRQWATCFEDRLLKNTCFQRVPEFSPLYV